MESLHTVAKISHDKLSLIYHVMVCNTMLWVVYVFSLLHGNAVMYVEIMFNGYQPNNIDYITGLQPT
jgi:hypothetical protein